MFLFCLLCCFLYFDNQLTEMFLLLLFLSDDDVLGGVMERVRNALLELFHKVASRTGDAQTFLKPAKDIAKASPSSTTTTPTIKPIIVPVIDDGDLL